MDKIHNKASKLFDDALKKKNKMAKNTIRDSNKINSDCIADLSYKCCNYCQKVFINSKFLMKHLLRRHSDELVLFYKNFNDHEFKNTSDDLRHLVIVLKEEFSSLKKELVSAKLAVHEKNETEDQSTESEETIHMNKKTQSINANVVSNEIRDLKEKIVDVERDMQNLSDKFMELDNILKNEVLMKKDVSTRLASSEEKIIQAQESQFIELRQMLLNELKSLLHNQQQEISREWKSQLLELRHEIKRLDFAIDNVKQQLKSTDSLKEEIEKELMPRIIPHISRRKCEKRKFKHSLLNTELSANKTHQASQLQEVSSHENFDCKKSNSNSFRKATFGTDEEIASMIADKLSQFSIEPNTSKISCAQFNKILRLLSIEKEQYSKKYDNFYEIYNKLNMAADQKAHSKLKTKKHHKIKFAEPLTSSRNSLNHSSFEDGMSVYEQSPSIQHRNKHFTSAKYLKPSDSKYSQKENHQTRKNKSFTPDKDASGDTILPVSNKQIPIKYTKLSSIRESETSDSEDIEMSKDLSAKFSKSNFSVAVKQSKYERHSGDTSSTKQTKLYSTANSNSIQHEENASLAFPEKSDCNDSILLFPNKQNVHIKHTKLSSIKKLNTSNPVEDIENSRNLNATVLKHTVTAEHSKYKSQQNCISPIEHRKLSSAVSSYTVPFKDASVFKTIDKCNDLKDYNKSDDFDDASSLEPCELSDDDDHPVACS